MAMFNFEHLLVLTYSAHKNSCVEILLTSVLDVILVFFHFYLFFAIPLPSTDCSSLKLEVRHFEGHPKAPTSGLRSKGRGRAMSTKSLFAKSFMDRHIPLSNIYW